VWGDVCGLFNGTFWMEPDGSIDIPTDVRNCDKITYPIHTEHGFFCSLFMSGFDRIVPVTVEVVWLQVHRREFSV